MLTLRQTEATAKECEGQAGNFKVKHGWLGPQTSSWLSFGQSHMGYPLPGPLEQG